MPKTSQYAAKVPDAHGRIAYSDAEHSVWRDLMARQLPAVRQHAAREFLAGMDKLELPAGRIPQCSEVSERLLDLTGWQVQAVPALIGFKEFFGLLAQKTFPAASFIRRREDFDYIVEPDIFHEIFGHTPLLTDERFALFSQRIGEAGLACDSADYAWLIRLYWFSIEFGLIRQDDGNNAGNFKALGSGLASSPTELVYSISDATADRKPFDVIDILRTPYRIDIHQPIYFLLDNADQLFAAADRDLLKDLRTARTLGLHAPTYEAEAKHG